MIKLSLKHWCFITAFILGGAILVATILNKCVHERPEVELSRLFLEKQISRISQQLDHIESITYQKNAAARVSFKSNKTEGFYCFEVSGNEGEMEVRVFWENARKGNDFRVIRIEQILADQAPLQIWP